MIGIKGVGGLGKSTLASKIFEEKIGNQEILPGLKEYREENKKGAFVVDLRIAYSIKKQYRFNYRAILFN
jgi:nucleoside-triphosphatase THEP1